MLDHATFRKLKWILTGLFIGLCLLHYFSQRPLWLDEGFVYESLTTYSSEQIFGPLKTQQAFPRVYLVFIKVISENFHYHLLALRLCALVAMMIAFLCWIQIYRRCISVPLILFLAILSFTCSYRLVYYGAELKHYSMDVLTVALYLLFFLLQAEGEIKKNVKWLWTGSVFLPATIFFSYSSLFVCWIASFNFFLMSRSNIGFRKYFRVNLICTLICAAVFYNIDLKYSFRQSGILQYWDSYFILTDSPLHFLDSIFEGIKRLVTYWCGTEKWHYRMAVPFIPFFLYALFRYGIKYIREDGFKIFRLESLMLVLFGELFLLGLGKFYPFTGERITLFLAPFVFYLILKGMDDLGKVKVGGRIWRMSFLTYYGAYCFMCLVNTITVYIRLYQ